MVYKYKDWTLYTRKVELRAGNVKSGKKRDIYYFSKKTPKTGNPCDMPDGYEIGINKTSGMPYLQYPEGRISKWKQLKKR